MLVEAPVLTQPTSGKEYTLYNDASGIGLGCVCSLDQDDMYTNLKRYHQRTII